MNKLFLSNIGELTELQCSSFYNFLYIGIKEEILKFQNPFFINIAEEHISLVYLYPNSIKLKNLFYNINFCIKNNLSYTIQIYIYSEYSYPFINPNSIDLNFFTMNFIDDILILNTKIFTQNIIVKTTKFFCNKYFNTTEFFIKFNIYKKINFKNDFLLQNLLNTDFINRKKIKQIKIKQNILLGEIPLITDEGTFIINGYEKIIINQIIRSPGIYFSKTFQESSLKIIYVATLISKKGNLIKIILDTNKLNQDYIYINLNDFITDPVLKELSIEKKKNYKIFFSEILNILGLKIEEIFENLTYSKYLLKQKLINIKYIKNQDSLKKLNTFILENITNDNFIFEKNEDLNLTDENILLLNNEDLLLDIEETVENKQKKLNYFTIIFNFIENNFFKIFSIGTQGRYQINKRLNLNTSKNIQFLNGIDFIHILNELLIFKYENTFIDDIDDIKNKIIKSVGDLLQNQLQIVFYQIEKILITNIKLKIISTNYKNSFINSNILTDLIKEFFLICELSQFMDQTNPLAELTHKRKISLFGPNGLKRENINLSLRDIHPSYYGRLCSIETPEGQNVGLISTLTLFSRINNLGTIETPYFFISNEKIWSNKQPLFLNTEQEFNFNIVYNNLTSNDKTAIPIKKNVTFLFTLLKNINFIITSPLQIISLATALIPFLEHNDTNRALMGSNMQRQAIPLLYTQKPIIGTGLETIAILNSNMILKTYSEGYIFFASAHLIEVKDSFNQLITYYLKKYNKSNQNTALNQHPIVWIGENVYSNQILADGPSTKDGELSLGKNLIIAYLPWEGYNFEDAIVINERLIIENSFTSIYIEKHEIKINKKKDKIIVVHKNFNDSNSIINNLFKQEKLFENLLINQINSNNLVFNKILFSALLTTNNLYNKILNVEIKFNNLFKKKIISNKLSNEGIIQIGIYIKKNDILIKKISSKLQSTKVEDFLNLEKTYYETSNKATLRGRIIDITTKSTENFETFYIYVAQLRKIKIGDKLSGRHGNKGIVSKILSSSDMPYLPDGTAVDIILNPLGVPSRMNVGQIFECLLGLAGANLGCRFKIDPFDEVYGKESSRILINQKLKQAAQFTNFNWLFNSYYPTKTLVRDGRTGEFFDNPVIIGKSYILKLIHVVEDKVHARSTGPYSKLVEQPVAGKSQSGAQKFGEMETWALEAYGCSYTLQEMLTLKSDDTYTKKSLLTSFLNKTEIPKSFIAESFLILIRELNSLGLDFSLNNICYGFNITSKINTNPKDLFKELEIILKLNRFLN